MKLYFERVGRFVILPVVHHSYEFAIAARDAFRKIQPAAVAVEYPAALQALIVQGLQRLPRVSVLTYGNPTRYIRIEPVDAFVEAARLALEAGIPVSCIDSSVDYPEIFDPMPDTYALRHSSHEQYCKLILEQGTRIRLEEDEIREQAMAFHLQDLESR